MSKGLYYKKLDLHVHTPASADFDDKSVTPKQIVDRAMAVGLDGIAVTDHNSGAWVDKIKEAAKGTQLKVFPGVEITAVGGEHGIHVIAIFDPSKTTKHVEGVLSSLKFKVDDYGKIDSATKESVHNVIKEITSEQHEGIAILAHANSGKGVLGGMKGVNRKDVISMPALLAVEATDFDNADKKKDKTRVVDLLDGKDSEYNRTLAVYRASDNPGNKDGTHGLGGIGARFTYFKVDDDFNIESLRQCLIDPDVRIRQMVELCDSCYPKIVSMEVSDGFLGGEKIEFHEGLNSVFGSKGVGKSLIVEFLRFALAQTSAIPSIKKDTDSKLEDRLGLLGKIEIVIELDNGVRYLIARTYDVSDGSPIECKRVDTGDVYSGEVDKLFPILAYSQTEVIKIAEDENAQLALIDKFIDNASFLDRIKAVEEKLSANDRKISKSIKANTEVANLRKDISTISEQLRNIDKSLKNKLFEDFKVWEARKAKIDKTLEFLQGLADSLEEYKDEFDEEVIPDISDADKKDLLLKKCAELSESSLNGIVSGIGKIRAEVLASKKQLDDKYKKWKEKFDKKKSNYEKLLDKLGGDKKTLEGRRRKLSKSFQEKEGQLAKCEKAVKEFGKCREERNKLLGELDKFRKEHFDSRKKKYDDLTQFSGGKLELSIAHGANVSEFVAALKILKKGTHLRDKDVDVIAEKVLPRDFIDALIDGKADFLVKKTGLPVDNVTRLLAVLDSKESLEDVLCLQHSYYPKDVPSIKFMKPDGKHYPLTKLSVGQKCTALLIIALSEGNTPIIIDQPEDSLDLLSIYSDIVLKLRQKKELRQFILTTHNANVAVVSDSDKYLFVDSSADKGHVECVGSIDNKDMKKRIIDGLEGGEKPHLLKIKKYNVKN